MTIGLDQAVQAQGASDREPREPVSYPPEAILTQEQAAAWLGVSTRTLRKLPIRRWTSSRRLVRYLARHVLEYLEEQAT